MDRLPLGDEDKRILELEGPTVVGHTAKIVTLAPPVPSLREIGESIAARIDATPELRRRLDLSAGEPAWVEEPRLELGEHLRDAGAVAAEDELGERVAALFAEHLDRSRPLWRIDAIDLPRGRRTLVWRLHHALADGTTAMRLASAALWRVAAQSPSDPARAQAPERASIHAGRDDERRRAHLGAFIERELSESLRRSPFDGEVGRVRSVAFADLPLAPLHDAAHSLADATLNDALLSIVAGAIGRWLAQRDRELGSLRIRVPVSLHSETDLLANRDSFFTVPAPISEPRPVPRLKRIREATAERKRDHDAERRESLLADAGRVSGRAREWLERLEASPRSFALAVSNVPGPRRSVEVCGARVERLYSLAEVGRRHGLRVTVVSCAGALGLGFCADPGIVSDVDRLAEAAETEGRALIDAAG